jgi:hypothetical protein
MLVVHIICWLLPPRSRLLLLLLPLLLLLESFSSMSGAGGLSLGTLPAVSKHQTCSRQQRVKQLLLKTTSSKAGMHTGMQSTAAMLSQWPQAFVHTVCLPAKCSTGAYKLRTTEARCNPAVLQ